MNVGDCVQSCDTCIFISNKLDVCTYQGSEKCSPTLSKCKSPKMSHLKCMQTTACCLGNKQQELELHAQSDSYDVIGITETWWENSHDDDHNGWMQALLEKNRKGRREGGVALYLKEKFEHMAVSYGDHESCIECLSRLEELSPRGILC